LEPLDRERLAQALDLAEQAIGLSDPNPRVGCVIGRQDGSVLGRGHTQRAGQAHAEVAALADAKINGADVRDATAWVTLEPCAHHGRTPPCCDALVTAGIARVVVGMLDPFPQVNGAGVACLRAAGLTVEVADGPLTRRAHELNIGFVHRIRTGRPWVRLKTAASLDGRTALNNGRSQWITSPATRADGHAWRRRAGAIVTGIGTVLADDPRLDVREIPTTLQPLRVVLDSHLRTPANARLRQAPGQVLICCTDPPSASAAPDGRIEYLQLPPQAPLPASARQGCLDLGAVLDHLATRQINEVHIEAGAQLSGAFLSQGLVDELLAYIAPMLIGPGRPLAALGECADLNQIPRFHLLDLTRVGDDVRLRLQRDRQ
jgi:diaminohydroxyphosphoribosylaminopyrimidine deaminase/5-amino-6-(5-phosphoribosylamino)uracil reductase